MSHRKPLLHDLPIPIRGGLEEVSTPHAGVAGLIELGRQSNVIPAAEKYLPAKQSPKGLSQGQMVEALVILSALGGECLDDFTHLRGDAGLAMMLGYTLPAAPTARQWLDRFHEEALLADRPGQGSFIPAESRGLAAPGLADELRDGNVPASVGIKASVDRAYGSLPFREGGWQVAVRSDSAAYEQDILAHWAKRGWRLV